MKIYLAALMVVAVLLFGCLGFDLFGKPKTKEQMLIDKAKELSPELKMTDKLAEILGKSGNCTKDELKGKLGLLKPFAQGMGAEVPEKSDAELDEVMGFSKKCAVSFNSTVTEVSAGVYKVVYIASVNPECPNEKMKQMSQQEYLVLQFDETKGKVDVLSGELNEEQRAQINTILPLFDLVGNCAQQALLTFGLFDMLVGSGVQGMQMPVEPTEEQIEEMIPEGTEINIEES